VRNATFSLPLILAVGTVMLVMAGCTGGMYEDLEVMSFREHLADEAKGVDMLQAMDKAQIKKTVLAGAYNSTFDPRLTTDFSTAATNNDLLFTALEKVPGRLVIFPLLRGDEVNLIEEARLLYDRGAVGFTMTNGIPGQRLLPLDDPRLDVFYRWCEVNKIPLLLDVDFSAYGEELITVLRQYPYLIVVGGRLLHLAGDLPALRLLLERHHNLLIDFSFGWDEPRKAAYEALAKHREEFLALLERYSARFLWGMQIIIAQHPARNVDWLTQYMTDARFFLENARVKLKFMIDDSPQLITIAGMNLKKKLLARLYNLNFQEVIDSTAIDWSKGDMHKLLIDAPESATYDKGGNYQLLMACVTGLSNPIEGIFSIHIKKILTGELTDWETINGRFQPLKAVTVSPFDDWIQKRMAITKQLTIEALPSIEAVRARLRQEPSTLAFIPFAAVSPEMRVLSIEGESPIVPYINQIARRNAGYINKYFRSYTLMLPMHVAQKPPAELVFQPHELRSIALTDHLLPRDKPFIPGLSDHSDPYAEAVFKIQQELAGPDLAVTVLAAPLAEACPADQRCIPAEWVRALDSAGVDLIALGPRVGHDGNTATTNEYLKKHLHQAIQPNSEQPATLVVRGKTFSFLTVDPREKGWSPDHARQLVAAAVAQGHLVFVYLFASTPDPEAMQLAGSLREAGAQAVVLSGDFNPQPVEPTGGRSIIGGLGNPAFAEAEALPSALSFIARFTYYGDQLLSMTFQPITREGDRFVEGHPKDLARAYEQLFPNTKGKPVPTPIE